MTPIREARGFFPGMLGVYVFELETDIFSEFSLIATGGNTILGPHNLLL